MLFYASEKYPKEDEYSKFISDHGGYTNAWTASENTNYQVCVDIVFVCGFLSVTHIHVEGWSCILTLLRAVQYQPRSPGRGH
jgi:hypothetical protein